MVYRARVSVRAADLKGGGLRRYDRYTYFRKITLVFLCNVIITFKTVVGSAQPQVRKWRQEGSGSI
jgi:hypothetical protein